MNDFQDHHRQKLAGLRHLPLCDFCVTKYLVAKHQMVGIVGLGSECVWHGTDNDEHRPADWLVDMWVVADG